VITRAGFEPVRQKIALVAGKPTEITQTLKPGQRFGTIKLLVKNGWGDVYLRGTKIGRAPSPSLRLPVGTQSLHLKNPGKNPPIEWDVSCDVSETEQLTCTTQMP
jgi:hypothetical protein